MTRPRILVLLFSVLLGLTLAQPAAHAAPPAARQLAGPGYHQPAVGLCYDLTADQAGKASSTKDAVPCDAPHTVYTVKVKRLSKPVDWSADKLYPRFATACHEAMYDVLGSTRLAAMSAYDLFWFIPTKKERAQGARWVRCDVGLLAGSGIERLPASLQLTSFPLPTKVARCLVGKGLATTSCSNAHAWKVKGAFKLDRLPRSADAYRNAAKRCPNVTNSRRYAYFGPSLVEWKAGNHFMVCFKPD